MVQSKGVIDDGYEILRAKEQERADGNLQTPNWIVKIGDDGSYTSDNTIFGGSLDGGVDNGSAAFAVHAKIGGSIYSDASGFTLQSAEKSAVEMAPMLIIVENHFNAMNITNSMFAQDIDKLVLTEVKYIKAGKPATAPQVTRTSEFEVVRIMFSDFHTSRYFFMFAFHAESLIETYHSYDRLGNAVGYKVAKFDWGYGLLELA
ncbi:MAG: hypothetical protein LBG13_00890 [Holosporales bacterium]|nr:hypothetical protein [Holosporales bacterium]